MRRPSIRRQTGACTSSCPGDPTDHVDARDLGRIERNVRPNERTEVTVQDLHVGGLLVVLVRQILARALLEGNLRTEHLVHDDSADRDVELLDHADEPAYDRDRESEW